MLRGDERKRVADLDAGALADKKPGGGTQPSLFRFKYKQNRMTYLPAGNSERPRGKGTCAKNQIRRGKLDGGQDKKGYKEKGGGSPSIPGGFVAYRNLGGKRAR